MFERLTERTSDGIAYTKIPLNESHLNKRGVIEQCFTGFVADRLAAYEDSGLSPEEITEKIVDLENKISDLKATLEIYRGFDGCRLNQLIDADMDGRLVVLPCKEDRKKVMGKGEEK